MLRVHLASLTLLCGLAAACGGSDSGSIAAGPTAPTPAPIASAAPTPAPTPAPAPACPLPPNPANLVESHVATRVDLSWSASSGAAEYVVIVGSEPSSSNSLFTNTSQTRYSWGGVRVGTYYARVQAKNACGTSGSSNEVMFTVTGF